MTTLSTVEIESLEKVFDDGAHNAFTDLCRFQNRFYLTFRSSPDGHRINPNSRIVVLVSDDADQWRECFSFSVPDRDVRDPHFVIFNDRLFIYSGTWCCDPARPDEHPFEEHLGFAAWSPDGENWEGPRALDDTHGYYIWRGAAFGGQAWLCGRRIKPGLTTPEGHPVLETALLVSPDGFTWKPASLIKEREGNETAFLFEDDGEIVAVARSKKNALLCRAHPPYQDWSRTDLGRFVGGPMLTKWGDDYLVGGRKKEDGPARTVLSWLANDQLHDFLELPSGGDNSYPGFVELDPHHGLLSYYSSHEGSGDATAPCSIYLARLKR